VAKKKSKCRKNVRLGTGAGALIRIYGSARTSLKQCCGPSASVSMLTRIQGFDDLGGKIPVFVLPILRGRAAVAVADKGSGTGS
jgi:hypothetical protein